jgi:hypothetical protein
MSLNPLLTNVGPNTSLYAPASGGGGGGGGGSAGFSTISVSSISFPAVGYINQDANPGQLVIANATTSGVNDISLFTNASANGFAAPFQPGGAANAINLRAPGNSIALTAGATDVGGAVIASAININGAPSSLTIIADKTIMMSPLAVSSITCSTINGVAPGGGIGNGSIAVSSITSFPGQANPSSILMAPGSGANFALTGSPLTANPGGDIILDTSISANALTTLFQPGGNANAVLMLSPSGAGTNLSIAGTDAGGALIAAVDSVNGSASTLTVVADNVKMLAPVNVSTITGPSGIVNVAPPTGGTVANLKVSAPGSANILNLYADNGGNAEIFAQAGGIKLSTISLLNGGEPIVYSGTAFGSKQPVLQTGYCEDWPQASTVLFSVPYDTDNVCVMITPTNRGISGGANPNMSLNNSFGTAGTGVSSIGFQVDPRNNGVGYNGSFFYLALPRNS